MTALLGVSRRALLTAALAAVLTAAAIVSPFALIGVIVVGVAALSLGWPRLIGLPSARGASAVIAATGLLSIVAVLPAGNLVALVAVLAFAVIAAFVHEMARRDGRPRLTESISGTVTGAVAVMSAAGWVVIGGVGREHAVVVTTAAALAAAALCTALPYDVRLTGALAIVLGAGTGLAVGAAMPALGAVTGVVIGAVAGVVTAGVEVLFDQFPASVRPIAAFAVASLPIAVLGVPAYALAHLLAA